MAENENSIKRILPHDRKLEREIIGAMLMDVDAISDVSSILVKADFYDPQYALLYEAIISLHDEGKPVDDLILAEKLRSMGAPELLYKGDFISGIVADTNYSVYAKEHARVVRDKSMLRALIHASEEIEKDCYEGKGSTDLIMDKAEESIYHLVQSKNKGREFTSMQSIVVNVITEIEQASRKKGKITGLPTGFIDLDHKLTGLHPGQMIVIAARPGMGKTAFVLNIARHVVCNEKVPVVIFNLEMSKESLVQRLVAMDSLVDSQNIRTGNLTDDEWDNIIESAEKLSHVPLFIDDNSSVTIADLRSKCRKLKQTEGIGLIIIDYLQLMNASHPVESRQQFIAEVSRALKGLARELEVPVIALSQLNRTVDRSSDHKPTLSDLRESGAIEQDADVVMFIHRPEKYDAEDRPGIAEIIVEKQRSGSTGPVDLLWQGEYTRFANLER